MTTIKNKKLIKLAESQKWKCYYCKEEMRTAIGKRSGNKIREELASIEHIYPKMDIRRYLGTPLVAAHCKCNQQKNVEFHKKLHEGYDSATKKYMTILKDLLLGTIRL